jgi:hypothetical protein
VCTEIGYLNAYCDQYPTPLPFVVRHLAGTRAIVVSAAAAGVGVGAPAGVGARGVRAGGGPA